MKYCHYIYQAVKDYFLELNGKEITDDFVDKLPIQDVLSAFLEWEGIIGYDYYFNVFMEAYANVKNQ